jgi:hypothetical protein
MRLQHGAMGEWNEYLVLDHVRRSGPTTRPEIARALGLSAATVSRIGTRLVADGRLREEVGTAIAAGRPARVLRFNARAGAVVGIDLGRTRRWAVLADLLGAPIAESDIAVAEAGGGFAALRAMWTEMTKLATRHAIAPKAMAVGVPAVVDPDSSLATICVRSGRHGNAA